MATPSGQRIIVGYHGCDAALAAGVLAGKVKLKPSANRYDWLGNGIYFWEHGRQRAYEWAIEQAKLAGNKFSRPAVLGARIDLGTCLDLLDTSYTRLLGRGYFQFRSFMQRKNIRLPLNRDARGSRRGDKVLRFLDCAVIDFALNLVGDTEGVYFQTVRGVFLEGTPAFPGSKIMLKSHLQIAVRDASCIKEFFRPEPADYETEA